MKIHRPAFTLIVLVYAAAVIPSARGDTINFPGSVPGSTIVYGQNGLGDLVGSYMPDIPFLYTHQGFLYSNGTYTSLDAPFDYWCCTNPYPYPPPFPGYLYSETIATAINDKGQIVGSFFPANFAEPMFQGFLYDNGVYTLIPRFQLVGIRLPDNMWECVIYPTGINDSGWVTGTFDIGGITLPGPTASGTFVWINGTYYSDDPIGRQLSLPPVPEIPEPSTLSLLGSGIVALIGYGWRHRKR